VSAVLMQLGLIASAHQTQSFRWSKLQNGGRFLWVLSSSPWVLEP